MTTVVHNYLRNGQRRATFPTSNSASSVTQSSTQSTTVRPGREGLRADIRHSLKEVDAPPGYDRNQAGISPAVVAGTTKVYGSGAIAGIREFRATATFTATERINRWAATADGTTVVGISTAGTAMVYSTDGGATWTKTTLVKSPYDIAYANGWWVIASFDNTPDPMLYCTQDITLAPASWTQVSPFAGDGTIATSIAYGNGYWVAGNQTKIAYINATNPTGAWTVNSTWYGGSTSQQVERLKYLNGNWIAYTVGNTTGPAYKATDPTGSWTAQTNWPGSAAQTVAPSMADFDYNSATGSYIFTAHDSVGIGLSGGSNLKYVLLPSLGGTPALTDVPALGGFNWAGDSAIGLAGNGAFTTGVVVKDGVFHLFSEFGDVVLTSADGTTWTATPLTGSGAYTGQPALVNGNIYVGQGSGYVFTTQNLFMRIGANPAPSVIAGTTTIPTPTLSTSVDLSPSVVSGSTTVFAPTVNASVNLSPSVVSGSTTIPTPTFTSSVEISPSVVSGSTSIPTPTIVPGPGVVVGSTTIPTPTINASVTISATAIDGRAAIPGRVAIGDRLINTGSIQAVAWNGTHYVAVSISRNVYYSTDGLSWTQVTNALSISNTWEGVAYANGWWVAVGAFGHIAYTTDPTGTWTAITDITATSLRSIATDGTTFVAVGDSGELWTATDPTSAGNWTSRTSSFSTTNISDVLYNNGVWVATGDSGKIATTTNPTSGWAQVTSNVTTQLHSVAADGYRGLLAVALTGNCAKSTDNGATWSAVTTVPSLTSRRDVGFREGVYIVVGGNTAAASILLTSSADAGATWATALSLTSRDSNARGAALCADGPSPVLADSDGSSAGTCNIYTLGVVTPRAGSGVSPPVVAGTTTIPAPTIATGAGDANISATVVSGSTTIPTPTFFSDVAISPSVVSGSTNVFAPTLHTSVNLSPSVVSGSTNVFAPTLSASSILSPSVITGTTSIPTPTFTSNVAITPAVLSGSTTIPTPVIRVISPSVVTGTTTIPTPTFTSSVTITPTVVSGSTSVFAPTLHTSVNLSPPVIAGTTDFPYPDIHVVPLPLAVEGYTTFGSWSFTDDFFRADGGDGTLGGAWHHVPGGDSSITSGVANILRSEYIFVPTNRQYYVASTVGGFNEWNQWQLTLLGDDGLSDFGNGPFLKAYVELQANSGFVFLTSDIGGNYLNAGVAPEVVAGDFVELEVDFDDHYKLWLNGTLLLELSNSVYSTDLGYLTPDFPRPPVRSMLVQLGHGVFDDITINWGLRGAPATGATIFTGLAANPGPAPVLGYTVIDQPLVNVAQRPYVIEGSTTFGSWSFTDDFERADAGDGTLGGRWRHVSGVDGTAGITSGVAAAVNEYLTIPTNRQYYAAATFDGAYNEFGLWSFQITGIDDDSGYFLNAETTFNDDGLVFLSSDLGSSYTSGVTLTAGDLIELEADFDDHYKLWLNGTLLLELSNSVYTTDFSYQYPDFPRPATRNTDLHLYKGQFREVTINFGLRGAPATGARVNTGSTVTALVVSGSTSIPTPTFSSSVAIAPTVVTGTTSIPSPTFTSSAAIAPSVVSGSTTVFSPTINASVNLSPPVLAGSTTITAPTFTSSVTITPTVLSGSTTITTPTFTSSAAIAPSVVTGTTTFFAPTLRADSIISASVVSGSTTIPPPSFSSSVAISPTVLSGSTTITAPTFTSSVTISPSVVSGSTSVFAPSIRTDSFFTPTLLSGSTTFFAPTLRADSIITAVAVSGSTTISTPTFTSSAAITAAVITGTTSIPIPTVQGAASNNATPTVITGTTTISTPTFTSSVAVSPSVVNGSTSITSPAFTSSAAISPTVLTGSTSIPAPSVTASASISPTVLSGSTSIPAPTFRSNVTITPTVVTGSTSVFAPTLHTTSIVSTTVVTGTTSIPTPGVTSSQSTAPATIVGSTTFFAPTIRLSVQISPSVVSGSTTITGPSVQAVQNASITVNVIAGSATIPVPAFVSGVTAAPSAVTGTTTVFTPTLIRTDSYVSPIGVTGTTVIAVPRILRRHRAVLHTSGVRPATATSGVGGGRGTSGVDGATSTSGASGLALRSNLADDGGNASEVDTSV